MCFIEAMFVSLERAKVLGVQIFSLSFFPLMHFLKEYFYAFILLEIIKSEMATYLFSVANNLFYNKPYIYIYSQKPIIQCHLTLVSPKGAGNIC